jgi:hypothetical protein
MKGGLDVHGGKRRRMHSQVDEHVNPHTQPHTGMLFSWIVKEQFLSFVYYVDHIHWSSLTCALSKGAFTNGFRKQDMRSTHTAEYLVLLLPF